MLPSQLCSFLSPALGKCSSAVSDPPLPTLPSLSSYCAPFITAERDSPKMAKHGRLVNVPKPPKRVQKGLKWSTYMFLTIWDPLGPIWTLLDHFKQKLIFCFEVSPPNPTLSIWGKKVIGPKGSQIIKNTWDDHFGPLSTLLGHFGTLTSLPCLAIFGPKGTIFGPSPVINGGPQSTKKVHHQQVSYVWPACRNPK